MTHPLIEIHPDVQKAIQENKPVVALESTIISHGMPWPQNAETAVAVEAIVRENGAIPATIAVFNGKCQVGITTAQINHFARAANVYKVSLRDLAYVLSKKLYGATTVAATMRIASKAGIKIFATGGIGGVHRGAADTMDISADLTEMGQTSVAIISAGVKSILDIELTLEYLETKGIPVVTFGQDEFPGFYSSKSGYPSPLRLDGPDEIAALLHAKWSMGLEGAVLIANPVPEMQQAGNGDMEEHIRLALSAAAHQNIKGKDITPFLLQYIATHTGGESLQTNIALILHNAKLGAQIARSFAAGTGL